jgi:C-terminal processing protease CtpA/Prc
MMLLKEICVATTVMLATIALTARAVGPTPEQRERWRRFFPTVNYGFETVERMQGNIGYLDLRMFAGLELGGETAAAALTFLANTDALIIDLRNNGGGQPEMIAFITSYLFDEPTHINDIYERKSDTTRQFWTSAFVPGRRFGGRKPVYILTSKSTFSGGEEFAYNLKALKRAAVIGETTGGGAHPVRSYRASAHLSIGVPFARAINPVTKTDWEGIGVVPDISLPADQSLGRAYVMALEEVKARMTDPEGKKALQQLLDEKKTQAPSDGVRAR